MWVAAAGALTVGGTEAVGGSAVAVAGTAVDVGAMLVGVMPTSVGVTPTVDVGWEGRGVSVEETQVEGQIVADGAATVASAGRAAEAP